MINIKRAMKTNATLRALTGLKIRQFKMLATRFGVELKRTFEKYRGVNLDRGNEFVLKSSCCRWVQWFLPALREILGRELVLPERKISDTEEFLRLFPGIQVIFIDATEPPIQRPKDHERQKANYSGKKKRHTRKNIDVNDDNKRILIVTETEEGKKHDFKIYKDDGIGDALPEDIPCFVDTGFQGIETESPKLTVVMPKKKPCGGELSVEEKASNKETSRRRILSEHAIGGVKRYGIVSDVHRNHRRGLDDSVMMVACGLWNYYLKTA